MAAFATQALGKCFKSGLCFVLLLKSMLPVWTGVKLSTNLLCSRWIPIKKLLLFTMSHCQTTKTKSHWKHSPLSLGTEPLWKWVSSLQGFSLLLAFLLVRPQQCYINEYTHITTFEYLSSVVQMSPVNKPTTNATTEILSRSYVCTR